MTDMTQRAYTDREERIARFAKAMVASGAHGHPALPCRAGELLFRGHSRSANPPIAKATVSQHLKELKDAGLIQGEIETPKVRYWDSTGRIGRSRATSLPISSARIAGEKDSCCG